MMRRRRHFISWRHAANSALSSPFAGSRFAAPIGSFLQLFLGYHPAMLEHAASVPTADLTTI